MRAAANDMASHGMYRRTTALFETGIHRNRELRLDIPLKDSICPRRLGMLSRMLIGEGQVDRAGELATQAIEEQRALYGDDSPQLIAPLGFLIQVDLRRKRYEDVLRATDTVLAIATRVGTLASKEGRYIRFHRALALFALKRNAETLDLIIEVVDEQKAKNPDEKSTLFSMLVLQARALARAGRGEEAKPVAAEALAIEPKPRGVDAEGSQTSNASPGKAGATG